MAEQNLAVRSAMLLHKTRLDLDLLLGTLPDLARLVLGLLSHDTTAPVAARLVRLGHVALLDGGHELRQLGLVLAADLGQGERGGGLRIC